jgi:hypothetical protein
MATAAELAVVDEYPALEENAALMGWKLERLSATSFVLSLPASDGSWFSVLCIADRYSAEPPAWHWYNPASKQIDQPHDTPIEVGFFHSAGVICAPWNRLAYNSVDPRGPHSDWQIGAWRSNPQTGGCKTLSAIAQRIAIELKLRMQGRKAVAA